MSNTGVSFVIPRIAAEASAITGIRTAYATIPRAVNDADLPGLVVLPGPAIYDYQSATWGETMQSRKRTYYLDLLYSRSDTGVGGEVQIAVEPLMDSLTDFFSARPGLWLDGTTQPEDVVFNSRMVGDSGYIKIEYAGKAYDGVRFSLEVEEVFDVGYTD